MVIFVVLRFKPQIDGILRAFNARMGAAESVKLGVMGQQLELSGTAKELLKDRDELLANQAASEPALRKAEQIQQAVPRLSNSMADLVGLALLNSKKGELTLEEIIRGVMSSLTTSGRDTLSHMPPAALYTVSKEFEGILDELVNLNLVTTNREAYQLTDRGREFFQRVSDKQQAFFTKFGSV